MNVFILHHTYNKLFLETFIYNSSLIGIYYSFLFGYNKEINKIIPLFVQN